MITHKIDAFVPIHSHSGYRSPADRWNATYGHGVRPIQNVIALPLGPKGQVSYPITPNTPKYIYNQWLGTLKFKRGDWVVNKRATFPYIKEAYLRCVGLVEVHYLCKFTRGDNPRPLVLELTTALGDRFHTTHDEWEVVFAPDDVSWHFDLPAHS